MQDVHARYRRQGRHVPQERKRRRGIAKAIRGLIKQNKHPRVQEFFQTRLKELAQWIFHAKVDARARNEAGNKDDRFAVLECQGHEQCQVPIHYRK